VEWAVSNVLCIRLILKSTTISGMGSMHAWETFGDGVAPDLQAVAKGLGGGLVYHTSGIWLRK
jgi:hypothetical protein